MIADIAANNAKETVIDKFVFCYKMSASFKLLSLWIFLTSLPHCASDELVSCRLGQTCVLPCRYEGRLNMVRWSRLPEDYNVHVYVNDRDELSNQYPLYTNRTSLPEGLSGGNASLLLSQVSLNDQGRFRCFTSSNRGDQRHRLELTVFAPVLQVVMEQEGQQLQCRSEGIYPRPAVVWTPSVEHNTTVSSSESGLFSVVSSVTLSDSEDKYICNISTEHSWRRAVLNMKELHYVLNEWSSHQEGLFSCLKQTDTESVILRLQVQRPNFADHPTLMIVAVLLMVVMYCFIFYAGIKDKKYIQNLKRQLKKKDDLLNKTLRKYQQLKKRRKTPKETSEPQPSQDQCPPEREDRGEGCSPDDPHQSSAVVRYSAASGQIHEEEHAVNSLEIEENVEATDQQNSELEELMSNHRESTEVKTMQMESDHED